ncbi:MAG: hypothetical protein GY811_26245 [Myxococcales bacterium]|nr:hypothetical protein [Myxococcales bacterium]
MTISLGANEASAHPRGAGGGSAKTPDVDLGIPQAVEFDSATLVNQVLIDVKNRWTRKDKFFLDIEIEGLNGGFVYHGSQLVQVVDTTIFEVDGDVASVIVDWTTDTTPRHVNETYTVCVQVLKRTLKEDGTYEFKLKGEQKCTDFGPF